MLSDYDSLLESVSIASIRIVCCRGIKGVSREPPNAK